MKLRNKKTGDVMDLECITLFDRPSGNDIGDAIDEFYSIAELNEEWEDCKEVEPLIKDKKIRKAVRAWAEANGFNDNMYDFNVKTLPAGTRFTVGHYEIEFIGFFIYDLKTGNSYTISELCGEDEE